MPKKTKAVSRSAPRRVNAAVRAEDDRLRDELRNADMRKFDKAVGRALKPPKEK
jgi:hypothetical protein